MRHSNLKPRPGSDIRDRALAAALSAGIIGGEGPEPTSWGMLEFAVSDPDGALVRVGRTLRS